jgi:hypothetical protein
VREAVSAAVAKRACPAARSREHLERVAEVAQTCHERFLLERDNTGHPRMAELLEQHLEVTLGPPSFACDETNETGKEFVSEPS